MIRRTVNLMAIAPVLVGLGACSILPTRHEAAKPSPKPSRFWPLGNFLSPHRTPPPPKATPLLEVGTIRSISRDASYVIVELAPGSLVRTGDALVVTSKEHPASKLRVEEVQPPCFAAEVVEGSVCPGDVVKR